VTPKHPNLRIGDVAKLAGTTPRTIRYYEELGLLPDPPERPSGGHRLKKLLGVTLQELKELLTAEEARAAVRAELRRDDVHPERRRELLEEALGHIDGQLVLVEHRATELAKLREELGQTRRRVRRKLREQAAAATGTPIDAPPSATATRDPTDATVPTGSASRATVG
jgi:MerR family transcriptional regulator, repressor of the yfmOP operon